MDAGRVIGAIVGALLVLTSAGLLAGAGALTGVYSTQRDQAGYLSSDTVRLTTDGFALRSTDLTLDGAGPGWAYPDALVGSVRVQAQSPTGTEIFVGVAPAAEIDGYLAQVQYAEVTDLNVGGSRQIGYSERAGGPPATAPTAATIWTQQAAGPGQQTLLWTPEPGSWGLVAMNADGSGAVQVDVNLAAEVPALPWLAAGLLAAGVLMLAIGAVAIAVAASRASAAATSSQPA